MNSVTARMMSFLETIRFLTLLFPNLQYKHSVFMTPFRDSIGALS